jgi:RHS repeat-associated protein
VVGVSTARLCNNNATSGSPATLTCPASPTYTFDAAGNQLVGGGHTISRYNAKNQTGTIDTINNTFADADQTERTAAGPTTFNTWLLGQDTSTVSGTARYYLRTPDGMLIGTSQGSTHHYYLHDGETNIVGLTNSSGIASAYYTYNPYGAHATATGTDAALNNFRYKSGWLNNSDIYKFGARYYHASDARWTQQDPIAGTITNAATINRYTYTRDHPIDNWDPSGRNFISDWVSQNPIQAAADVLGCGLGAAVGVDHGIAADGLVGAAFAGVGADPGAYAGGIIGGVGGCAIGVGAAEIGGEAI